MFLPFLFMAVDSRELIMSIVRKLTDNCANSVSLQTHSGIVYPGVDE